MTHFKPTVDDYNKIDGELVEINERLNRITETLGLTFGQRYATMLVKASLNVSRTRSGIKEKIMIEHPEVE
jgi:hypothetical protein